MTILLALIVLAAIAAFLLIRSEQMGALASGERLKRMEAESTYKEGAFQNLEITPAIKEGVSQVKVFSQFFFGKDKRNVPSKPLPVQVTDLKRIPLSENVMVWFGHSSYYLQLDGKRILVDPVFSGNASPIPRSVRAFPMQHVYTAADMPEIDILVITHDHWDHLDYPTFKKLKDQVKQVITGEGVGAHLERWGYPSEKIHELYWGQQKKLDSLTFTSAPARHFSGRWLKRNTSLWSSFVLQGDSLKLYLGGDSGYGSHFKKIGAEYGPFDLAILENGQYNENWQYIHMMPEEAVLVGQEIGAKAILPVHNSKFPLANHAWDEPMIRITKEAKAKGLPIHTPEMGQLFYLDKPNETKEWWLNID
ncbi:MBL fold metallo-hydrolase [Sphingobacterium lactis]|uniref:L-ascorbate metabolism protein UlaG, beta-lactamase superfamily n=2 Tax=Sphingobacterium lactis TaxID=797291 RepID=A0A1H5Y4J5_9SPHI|nr:MBL fold metallo-hydrolase [Sphingobacterium lactis]SEG18818.1 L-ascorbate metabolism protein UlaG, beta-lactamase superfamily [Sphingobacterium lactis]